MKTSRILPVFALVLSASVLTGCSDDPMSTPIEETTTTVVESAEPSSKEPTEGPSEEDLTAYFSAIASNDPDEINGVVDLTASGSLAESYAIYFGAVNQASRDYGMPSDESNLSETEDGFEICPDVVTDDDPCVEYTNLKHDGDKLASFEVNGNSLDDRISVGDGEAQELGTLGSATFIAAYKSVAGNLVVVFDVRSQADGLWVDATYTALDGRQAQATMSVGPTSLSNGNFGTMAFNFEGAEVGGIVTLTPWSDSVYDSEGVDFATN